MSPPGDEYIKIRCIFLSLLGPPRDEIMSSGPISCLSFRKSWAGPGVPHTLSCSSSFYVCGSCEHLKWRECEAQGLSDCNVPCCLCFVKQQHDALALFKVVSYIRADCSITVAVYPPPGSISYYFSHCRFYVSNVLTRCATSSVSVCLSSLPRLVRQGWTYQHLGYRRHGSRGPRDKQVSTPHLRQGGVTIVGEFCRSSFWGHTQSSL